MVVDKIIAGPDLSQKFEGGPGSAKRFTSQGFWANVSEKRRRP
jgi:hypothetical protein